MRINKPGEKSTYLQSPGKLKPQHYYKILNTSKSNGEDSGYHITFRITESCDLECLYCDWNGGKHYKFEDIIKSLDVLFEFFKKENIQTVNFYYHGGEATRHPDIVDILKYVHHKGKEYNITAYNEMQTNFTIDVSILKEILKYTDLLDITFHYTELKKKNKLQSFLNNFKYLIDNNIVVHNFDIMLEYINENEIIQFRQHVLDFLLYKNIVNSEMIYDFGYEYEFNHETETMHYDFYKEHNKTIQEYEIDGKKYTTNDLFQLGADFTDWVCEAGKEKIYVNGNGDVYQCGIAMTNGIHNLDGHTYSNLLTDNMVLAKLSILKKTGTLCRWNYCGGDFYIKRFKK